MAEKINKTTAGLGGLLSGVYTGIQANRANQLAQAQLANQNQELAWKNPYRAPSELDKLKVDGDPVKNAIASMIASANQVNKPPVAPQSAMGVADVTNASAPVQVQKFDWLSATPDDFSGWQAEMKKRQGAK